MSKPQPLSAFGANTYSYTLNSSAREAMERLSSRGCTEFELMMYPGHLWPAHAGPQERRELRAFMQGNGLSLRTLNMPNIDLNIAAATAEMRSMTLDILQSVVVLAGDLGAKGVVIGPGKANPLMPLPRADLVARFHEALRHLVPLAADAGTAILVENMPLAFLPGVVEMLHAVTEFGDDRVGIVYDAANGHFVGEDLCQALRLCGPRLRVVHLSDTGRTHYRHDAVGQGTVDFRPLPAALREIGFRHRPVLEIIAPEPDTAIEVSARALLDMGWGEPAAAV